MPNNKQNIKNKLRKTIKQKRLSLSTDYVHSSSQKLATIILEQDIINQSKNLNIAFYLAHNNELSLDPIIQKCLALSSIKSYLPVLEQNNNQLKFIEYNNQTKLITNQYNIKEPNITNITNINNSEEINPKDLDIVFVPLIAFDLAGNRLGMGKGYYDRTFAFLTNSINNNINKPILIGIGYDFQYMEHLPTDTWDVKLHAIATESKFVYF